MEDTEDANNVEGNYPVTATIKANTVYELEVIKAGLTRAGANILRITTTAGQRGLGGQGHGGPHPALGQDIRCSLSEG
jgi:hypothetical protein